AARASDWVDYPAVYALKLEGLRLAFQAFNPQGNDARAQAFQHFVQRGGKSLQHQAAFDALHHHLQAQDAQMWGWPVWPPALRRADSPDVAQFCRQHAQEVTFFLWLQWLADSQLADCYHLANQHAMPIGLYRDLAVGVAQGGAETWSEPELYCLQASVGAPPDILGPLGQNWGLPPMDPQTLHTLGYQPFIEMLRANMRHCGALRIDHVMSLLRLWWIPQGASASEGAYVQYPLDDLLAILALESQRNHCMVIGEDLGTVPVEIIAKLREYGVYSYKVLYFERDGDHVFRAPQSYNVQAMATVTTHDLPTLHGYWQADDLRLGERLGLYPDREVLAGLYQDRAAAKQGLLDGLHHYGCLPRRTGRHAERMTMTPCLNRGIQRYVADSASALLGLQPEDWLNMTRPVNVPGTCNEYPNWRRKLSATLEELFNNDQINRLIKDLDKRRRRVSAG
ncbi:4-alpha-glucanotransferase, partial [Edwardsiella hoshinae]